MSEDLFQINVDIPKQENAGNRVFFEELLAPVFSFRRANGAFDSREMFLLSVAEAKPDQVRSCDSNTIRVHEGILRGEKRALVTCTVVTPKGAFDNLRVFVKDGGGRWKLLSWANEKI